MSNCRLLIIEQRLLREGIRAILPSDFEIVAEASTGQEAVTAALQNFPEMALLGLPVDVDPPALIAKLLRTCRVKILVLGAQESALTINGVLRAGATGFVAKDASAEVFGAALMSVRRGLFFLCPAAAARLAQFVQRGGPSTQLSAREREVLRAIANGGSSKEISTGLGLEEHTVRSYRKSLMKKLGVQNVVGLLQTAREQGLLG